MEGNFVQELLIAMRNLGEPLLALLAVVKNLFLMLFNFVETALRAAFETLGE